MPDATTITQTNHNDIKKGERGRGTKRRRRREPGQSTETGILETESEIDR